MVIRNDYQNRFYEFINNIELKVQLESFYKIIDPYASKNGLQDPYLATISGTRKDINSKMIKVTVGTERP